MNTPYTPIACSLHDEYEIAIMKKSQLAIQWLDENGDAHNGSVQPIDLRVKNKEEFLVFTNHVDQELCIRLDRITFLPL